MRKFAFIGIFFALTFISATISQGQPAKDVWGAKGEYCRMYDPGKGVSGVRFTLKTDKGPIEVILGPSWYVDRQSFILAPQDKVKVKGSVVAVSGQPTIIATAVTKGKQTWKLRHSSGMPVWVPQSGIEPSG